MPHVAAPATLDPRVKPEGDDYRTGKSRVLPARDRGKQRHFVAVGQQVVAGQTVLLIEAMKTFNQIKAPKAGTVTRILVENSAPVEYGEVLMILE